MLRRLIRRTVRSLRLMGVEDPAIESLVRTSYEAMRPSYADLDASIEKIVNVAATEEDAFRRTLVQGTTVLDMAVASAKKAGRTSLSGADAFKPPRHPRLPH
ncbi:hypothetical protein GCM10025876_39310 [Demequina litorisediminis]|uniref:Alanyl-tRNA synthetase class IIc N-terminal domain-containing protein n=1 Tax=Demequina litorisediminis TaxID=1849022 RepID=A0ABQ6IKP6_9MICO|nr:hypothetical protein GCM10025876_39310 [Demequina litorisediminis]